MERFCNECEEPISIGRLLAIPTVGLCIGCQELIEKNGDHQRHRIAIVATAKAFGDIENVDQIIMRGDECPSY